jgi:thymidylate synthase (FAD)
VNNIRVVTNCTVRLVAKSVHSHGMLEFIRSREADGSVVNGFVERASGDFIPEAAGRTCYDSFKSPRPGGNEAYLQHIKESGHGSVLEHATFSFVFEGISRSLSHELVRHRAGWAFSQLSQRYHDESECGFVAPPALLGAKSVFNGGADPDDSAESLAESWLCACASAANSYSLLANALLESGCERKQAREAARSVLPNCVETRVLATANARAVRHFLEQRGSRHADAEVRRLANKVLEVVRPEAPNLFSDYRLGGLPDGSFEIVTDYRKV